MLNNLGFIRATALAILMAASATSTSFGEADDREAGSLVLPAPAAEMTADQWEAFGDRLVDALSSDHEGLQKGAMRLTLQYARNVDVRDAVIDVMRIYRNHRDDNVRRLAVLTLGSMNSTLAVNYLRLSEAFEDSPAIKRTIRAVLAEADGLTTS